MAAEPWFAREPSKSRIDLYWIPVGAGGAGFVRLNGRVYEAIQARLERRRRLDLYHTALELQVAEERFIVENAWPSPNADAAARGVVVEGPVGSRRLARLRLFRYEVRRWRDGVIPDAGEAVASPQRLSNDPGQARRLLDLVASVPALMWGRDELGAGYRRTHSGHRPVGAHRDGRLASSRPNARSGPRSEFRRQVGVIPFRSRRKAPSS